MTSEDWKLRLKLFVQRFWQPTCACMSCMPGGIDKVWSASHWNLALHTGILTALLAVALSFTPLKALYRHRYGNALMVALLTMVGDAYAHPDHYDMGFHVEAIVTGMAAFVLALLGSWLFEDRARRIRRAWGRLVGRGGIPG